MTRFRLSSVEILVAALFLLGISAAGCSPGGHDAVYDTAVVGADLERTGTFPGDAPTLDTLVWRFEAEEARGLKEYGEIMVAPAVKDGKVYVGSVNSNLYALDAATGEEEWAFTENRSSIDVAPAVGDSTVFFSSGGGLYAIDLQTREERWRHEEGLSPIHPLIHDEGIYLGDIGGHVYALDRTTGEERWSRDMGEVKVESPPALSDGRLYVLAADLELVSIELDSGEDVWSVRPDVEERALSRGSPVVHEELVYVGNVEGQLFAFDKTTGEETWRVETSEVINGSPTVFEDVVYLRTYCDGDVCLYALDAHTGEEIWQSQYKADAAVTSPATADGVLYFGAGEGLYAVDAETGDQIGHFPVEGGVQSAPVILNGRVYFPSGRYLNVVE